MGSVAEFRWPLSEFGLRSVIETASDVEVTVQQPVHARRDDRVLLRIRNGERRELTEALTADPSIDGVERLGGSDHSHLYLVGWDDGFTERLEPLVRHGGIVETLWGCNNGWHVCTLFPTREAIRDTYDHLVERGRPPRIERIYDFSSKEAVSSVPVDV